MGVFSTHVFWDFFFLAYEVSERTVLPLDPFIKGHIQIKKKDNSKITTRIPHEIPDQTTNQHSIKIYVTLVDIILLVSILYSFIM